MRQAGRTTQHRSYPQHLSSSALQHSYTSQVRKTHPSSTGRSAHLDVCAAAGLLVHMVPAVRVRAVGAAALASAAVRLLRRPVHGALHQVSASLALQRSW